MDLVTSLNSHVPLKILIVERVGATGPGSGELHRNRSRRRRLDGGAVCGGGVAVGLDGDESRVGGHGGAARRGGGAQGKISFS